MLVSVLASFFMCEEAFRKQLVEMSSRLQLSKKEPKSSLSVFVDPIVTPKPDSKAYQITAAGKQERVACFRRACACWSDQNQEDDGTGSVFTFAQLCFLLTIKSANVTIWMSCIRSFLYWLHITI